MALFKGPHAGVLEKAGLGDQLTKCLQFQEQRAEDRIHFPPLGELGGMPWGEGHLGCQLITQPPASGDNEARGWLCVQIMFNTSGFLCANGGGIFLL